MGNRTRGQIAKVRNFLFQMGAYDSYLKSPFGNKKVKRRFRKIKRLAFERVPSYMKNDSAYQVIYHAFKLHQYGTGGYYWKDLRRTFRQPRWDRETSKMVYDEPEMHYSKCRRWSLNGPVTPEEFERIIRVPPL